MAYERKPGEPLTVEFVPAATVEPLVSVKISDSLALARTQMELHGFSQLPVLRGPKAVGVVSWESIGRTLVRNVGATLEECLDESWQTVRLTDELLPIIPRVNEHGYVVVLDERDHVRGIVTGADLGELLAGVAGPFLEFETIENVLREIVTRLKLANLLSVDTIKAALPKSDKPADRIAQDFTFGELRQIICSEKVWPSMQSSYDRESILHHLDDAVRTRNLLMHFRTLTEKDNDAISRLPYLRKVMVEVRDGLENN
ncbi:CBS domain-containing protein [Glutamicibacter creatinolyticus]|uniref:CBS domain-containing protein n=1 Tax=Glutamicibacter creatinolyticus TaxID=162496 RepID=UPI0031DE8939